MVANLQTEAGALLPKVSHEDLVSILKVQDPAGIGQGRVTNNLGTFIEKIDGAVNIPDEKTISMVYDILDAEGIYLGASSALNVVAAVEVAQQLKLQGNAVYHDSTLQ